MSNSSASAPRRADKRQVAMAEAFQGECVLFFEEVVQVFGLPKSVGQIYGLLFASPAALSFSDIVDRLGISKGSASQGLGLLRLLGAINEAKGDDQGSKGDRTRGSRTTYEPELSLRRLVSGLLNERIAPIALTSATRFARLNEFALQGGTHAGFFKERVTQLNVWRRRMKTVLPVLGVLLGPKR